MSAGVPDVRAARGVVSVEVAQVYRGGGRRWLTKKAAARAAVRQMIRAKCDCEPDDVEVPYPGARCHYHADQERYERIVARMARKILYRLDRA